MSPAALTPTAAVTVRDGSEPYRRIDVRFVKVA
jgi:hypothetical protein